MEVPMSRLSEISFEPLEPYDGKLSCTVLRGESSRKGADLPDQLIRHYTSEKYFNWIIISIAIITKILTVHNLSLYDEQSEWFRATLGYRVFPYFMYFVLGLIAKKYNEQFIVFMKNDYAKAFFIITYIGLFSLNYHHNFYRGLI